jgi:DNA processing protein
VERLLLNSLLKKERLFVGLLNRCFCFSRGAFLDYRKYVIALREEGGVGPKTFQLLLSVFGSPENVYKKSLKEIKELPRISPEKAERILASQDKLSEIEEHILFLEKEGIGISTILDENYPSSLRQINSPPPLLYYKGEFPIQNKTFVALVGTNEPTEEGKKNAVLFGRALASRGVVVVSGLAKGIDKESHMGALIGEGKTYAVLGSGLNSLYPKENIHLAKEITENGAILTEYPLNAPVNVGQLMSRNRIIVGLSQAVVVVETVPGATGVMDAVQRAKDQGKPVFLVKKEGFLVDPLWKDVGALIIRNVQDLDMVLKYI